MPYTFEDGAKRLLMPVNNAIRKAAGDIKPGDTVTFELERDEASRSATVDVPPDLEAALHADSGSAVPDAMSPSRRREAAEHIASAKRDVTRARRVQELLAALR